MTEALPMKDALPMKGVTGTLPTGPGWVYEVKWDGMRALVEVEADSYRVRSTRGRDVTVAWPELAGLPAALGTRSAVLDGELVAIDDAGRPDFGRLQHRMHVANAVEAARRAAEVPVTYLIFDLLELDGHDLTGLPLSERRRVLAELVEPGAAWRVSPQHDDGEALLEAATAKGLEGVMAKRRDSRYEPGRRSPAWRKVKVRRRQEMVVGGWAPGEGGRAGRIGALLVGCHDPAGGPLRYAGRVGTGFTDAELARLASLLAPLETNQCPFDPPPPGADVARGVRWTRPEVVAELAFGEWTSDGRLRHPSYLGTRDDKDPRDVVREAV